MGRKKKGDMSAKKIRVSYTINPDLVDKMLQIAKKHGQPASAIFEEAVEHFLELVKEQEAEKPEPKRLLRRSNDEPTPAHEV